MRDRPRQEITLTFTLAQWRALDAVIRAWAHGGGVVPYRHRRRMEGVWNTIHNIVQLHATKAGAGPEKE